MKNLGEQKSLGAGSFVLYPLKFLFAESLKKNGNDKENKLKKNGVQLGRKGSIGAMFCKKSVSSAKVPQDEGGKEAQ